MAEQRHDGSVDGASSDVGPIASALMPGGCGGDVAVLAPGQPDPDLTGLVAVLPTRPGHPGGRDGEIGPGALKRASCHLLGRRRIDDAVGSDVADIDAHHRRLLRGGVGDEATQIDRGRTSHPGQRCPDSPAGQRFTGGDGEAEG